MGNHPPSDKAKDFRESNFKTIRHLGKIQMTTDTAVLTSHKILDCNKDIAELDFIDNPEMPLGTDIVPALDWKFTPIYDDKAPQDLNFVQNT